MIEWKSAGHDGGDMTFGLDGMFYITTGDGTSDSDGWDSGQTLNDLLGSVLRIDVHRQNGSLPYAIPKDNPFVQHAGARPEIWAYGLRNPWRMCTDAKTGHIWVGNNGQDLWETAYSARAAAPTMDGASTRAAIRSTSSGNAARRLSSCPRSSTRTPSSAR